MVEERGVIEQHDALVRRHAEAKQAKEAIKDQIALRRAELKLQEQVAKDAIKSERREFKAQKRDFVKDLERKIWQLIQLFVQSCVMRV